MAGFGENLRHEREMRDISLREISETTKIKIQFLEALEKEKFSDLPGGIYTRSFIRSYANYLGLDPDRVLAEYELAAPPQPEEDYSKLGVAERHTGRKKRMLLVPWLGAALLLGGGYALFHYSHRVVEVPVSFANPAPVSAAAQSAYELKSNAAPATASPQQVTAQLTTAEMNQASGGAQAGAASDRQGKSVGDLKSVPAATSPAKPDASPVGKSPLVPQQAASGSTTGMPQPLGAKAGTVIALTDGRLAAVSQSGSTAGSVVDHSRLVLTIAATEPCWIEVQADGKKVLASLLSPNEVRTVSAKNSFDITAGNAQGVSLALNGITLKPLGPQGVVKEIRLTRKNLEQINP